MLRKDYILDRWTYISPQRNKRPQHFKKIKHTPHPRNCPFCSGREAQTPPEKGRIIEKRKKWLIRWMPNKFPALSAKESSNISNNQFFFAETAYGLQEVIVETPDKRQLADLSNDHIAALLKVYNYRIQELEKLPNINYVSVFKNKGKEAGASIVHSHSQVIATKRIPHSVKDELETYNKFKYCPYCRIIEDESKGPRQVFENKDFTAFCPYAPRFNYEVWIFPKQHMNNLTKLKEKQYFALAEILKKILKRLQTVDAPYCFYIQYGPYNQDFHWHIELLPRLNTSGGFELSGGDIIVTVSPEKAANFYKSGDNN
jgi:UDPglucose--hexose-1-phosphate uridylyltransferase